jgi:hypothetical protein
MRWLDGLGWCKWPSLFLIVCPCVAFGFWLPETSPASYCGNRTIAGRAFAIYRTAPDGGFILRPISGSSRSAPDLRIGAPTGFAAGGMMVAADDPGLAPLDCSFR